MSRINTHRPHPAFNQGKSLPPRARSMHSFLLLTTAALAGCGMSVKPGPSTVRQSVPDAKPLATQLSAEESLLASFIDQQIPPGQQALAQALKERVNSMVQTLTAIDEGVILPFNAYEFRDQWFYNYDAILQNFRVELARSVEWISLRFDDTLLAPFEFAQPSSTAGDLPPALREAILTFVNTQHQVSLDFLEKDPATDVARPLTEQTQIRDVIRVVCIRLGSAIRGSQLFE